MSGNYFGKYRGRVADIEDPEARGRIKVRIASLFGEHLTDWALPCFALASDKAGLFGVPPKDSWVWIEFEQGDPNFPIWTGCFWDKRSTLPEAAHLQPGKSLAILTAAGHSIDIRDEQEKGISLQVANGPSLRMKPDSVVLKLANGTELTLDGGGILLKSASGARLELGQSGVTLENGSGGKLKLTGMQVSINDGALEVT